MVPFKDIPYIEDMDYDHSLESQPIKDSPIATKPRASSLPAPEWDDLSPISTKIEAPLVLVKPP
jgi:hypothetical protein